LLIVAALIIIVGLEWLLGKTTRKIARHIWSRIVTEYRKANKL